MRTELLICTLIIIKLRDGYLGNGPARIFFLKPQKNKTNVYNKLNMTFLSFDFYFYGAFYVIICHNIWLLNNYVYVF